MAAKRSPTVPNSEPILDDTWLKITAHSDVPSPVALTDLATTLRGRSRGRVPVPQSGRGVLAGASTAPRSRVRRRQLPQPGSRPMRGAELGDQRRNRCRAPGVAHHHVVALRHRELSQLRADVSGTDESDRRHAPAATQRTAAFPPPTLDPPSDTTDRPSANVPPDCPDVLMWHTPGALRKVVPAEVSVGGLVSYFWLV